VFSLDRYRYVKVLHSIYVIKIIHVNYVLCIPKLFQVEGAYRYFQNIFAKQRWDVPDIEDLSNSNEKSIEFDIKVSKTSKLVRSMMNEKKTKLLRSHGSKI